MRGRVTADLSRFPERSPAWFVATDQGVVLAGPFDTVHRARAVRTEVVESLRRELMADRRPGAFIAERITAVEVRWGVLVGPWGQFETRTP